MLAIQHFVVAQHKCIFFDVKPYHDEHLTTIEHLNAILDHGFETKGYNNLIRHLPLFSTKQMIYLTPLSQCL
jgi:hypothetical protein